jgi:hypothetical protein
MRQPSLRTLIVALIVVLILPFIGAALFVMIRLSDAEHQTREALCCMDRQADAVSVTSFVVRRGGHTPVGRVRACDLGREQRRPPQSRDAALCVSATRRRSRA